MFGVDSGRIMNPEKEFNPDVDRVTISEMIGDPGKYCGVMSPVLFLERGT